MQVEDFAEPVLRAPSPASSIGSQVVADQTSFSDSEGQISQASFERKWMEKLELDKAREEELQADKDPLLPKAKNEAERKALFEQAMRYLRAKVAQVEENELFEQIHLRNSQIETEPQPTSRDIDVIMRSMMISPATRSSNTQHIRQGSIESTPDRQWTDNGGPARPCYSTGGSIAQESMTNTTAPSKLKHSRRRY